MNNSPSSKGGSLFYTEWKTSVFVNFMSNFSYYSFLYHYWYLRLLAFGPENNKNEDEVACFCSAPGVERNASEE